MSAHRRAGQARVVYRYQRPFRDGSTHVVLEPLDFMAPLAGLVPGPRLNPGSSPGQALTRFARIIPDTHPTSGIGTRWCREKPGAEWTAQGRVRLRCGE